LARGNAMGQPAPSGSDLDPQTPSIQDPDHLALRELLDDTLRQVIELLRADAGAIFIRDEDAPHLTLTCYHGMSDEFALREARLPLAHCFCSSLMDQSGALFLVEDATQDPRCVVGACIADGYFSLLCLPLRANGQTWGLLRLHGRRRSAFDHSQERLLSFISSQLGLAIQRERLQAQIAHLLIRIGQQRATLDSLMRSLIDGLILVDDQGQILYWNPASERYLGIPAKQAIGQRLTEIGLPLLQAAHEPEQALDRLSRALQEVASRPQVELQLSAPSPRTLQVRFFPLEGRPGYAMILRDITSERRLEEMKSQLLATVSHELRTPLASIKGFATTLLREDVQWDAGTQREFLQIIDQEADRLGELIANLLEMSRIDARVLRIDPSQIDPGEMIGAVVEEMRLRANSRTLILDLPASLPPLDADGRRIRQVLYNLIGNALKYSTRGPIRVSARVEGAELVVSVADQGIGIAPDHLERVFERFYQVDAAATRRAGGVGLGLSICKGIIEAHGGRIWAESTLGVGSTFSFSLPLNCEAARGNMEACPERQRDDMQPQVNADGH